MRWAGEVGFAVFPGPPAGESEVLLGELLGGFALAFGGDEVGGNAAGGAGAGGGRGEPEPGMRRRVLGDEFAIEEALLAEPGGGYVTRC